MFLDQSLLDLYDINLTNILLINLFQYFSI